MAGAVLKRNPLSFEGVGRQFRTEVLLLTMILSIIMKNVFSRLIGNGDYKES